MSESESVVERARDGESNGESNGQRRVEHVTCLGCGLACDDITVVVRSARIAALERACPLGARWFGDGAVPRAIRVAGRDASIEEASGAAARIVASAERPLVYLAADLSCEAQREAAGLASRLGAMLDSVSSATVLPFVLAAQRRGRATATFGEIRNRGDVIVFWGVDPAERYPRFEERVAPEPEGMYVVGGRGGRTVIAVDVGDARGPARADRRMQVAAADEERALALARAAVVGRAVASEARGAEQPDTLAADAATLADTLAGARYAVIVHDAEPHPARTDDAAEGLLTLAQALNGPTRCALITLRAGGNRSGAEAVLTWRTGFPLAVDFARGAPRYRPLEGASRLLERGEFDAALILGMPRSVPGAMARSLGRVRCIAVGPRASENAFGAEVVIDTGVAGIHEGGTAVRADDVPLPLRPSLEGPASATQVLRELARALSALEPVATRAADAAR
ncbi:MAG: hypothetical protein WKG32_18360 [Gemmatimonadaceae bacterium]